MYVLIQGVPENVVYIMGYSDVPAFHNFSHIILLRRTRDTSDSVTRLFQIAHRHDLANTAKPSAQGRQQVKKTLQMLCLAHGFWLRVWQSVTKGGTLALKADHYWTSQQIENVPELPNRCRQCAIVFSLCNCSQHGRSRTSLNSAKTEVHVARRTGLGQVLLTKKKKKKRMSSLRSTVATPPKSLSFHLPKE